MMPFLSVNDLSVNYGAVTAVNKVSFSIEQGEIIVLLGANGVGKSSTLNAIMGLSQKTNGSIVFCGEDISHQTTEFLVRKGITLSPEGRRLFTRLTVLENLKMGAYCRKKDKDLAASYERVFELFPILKERINQLAGTLSGGQQQMLAIGRTLMSNPKMLLLDEPSLGLAPQIVEVIFDLISKLRSFGISILLVEQNVNASLDIADRGYVMAAGQIIAQDSAHNLKSSHVIKNAYLGHV